ncbi:putative ABC transport system permease protein [Algoriphagus alkaliphilus]|uniref:Putative ABC transport system permease protein n=1 Tax=Algoriphagus alkaliphilus TaxID=279824 RepID=A0A1G5W528_9BACT|nr:ABC transporter permease [Algoriphagus alkaliphilus]SDA53044.1 putative ABC transport system permease protein [Algoriphagus alkaliphilus]
MFLNYLKIAWRNFLNLKTFGIINLVGLTAGTVCSLAILLYVQSQFGFEKHFDNYENIYKVTTFINNRGEFPDMELISGSPAIGPGLVEDFEEVIQQTRVVSMGGEFLMKPEGSDKSFFESNSYLVDSTFFEVFNFSLLEGDRKTALMEPRSLVLSSFLAEKLFGKGNAIVGKEVLLTNEEGEIQAKVTAVFDEHAGPTHLTPNFLLSMASTGLGNFVLTNDGWAGNNFVHTYVQLSLNTNPDQLALKLPDFLQKHGAEQLKAGNMDKTLGLFPIKDLNLRSAHFSYPLGKISDINYLYILIAIGFFVQLMACINYINLTTAQALRRAKEIGVRKVNGASSQSLMYQFVIESIFFSLFAVIISLPILIISLPYLNQLFDSSLVSEDVLSPQMLLPILALGFSTGIISGAYPAFYLGMINVNKVFKVKSKAARSSFSLRNGLVVFQFSMVFLLVYAVAVVSQQLSHLNEKDPGFTKNQKLVIPLKTATSSANYNSLKSQFEGLSQVNSVTGCEFYPSQNIWYDNKIYKKGTSVSDGKVVQLNYARENFFETMDIQLLEGRTVAETDSNKMVVNESFLKNFGIAQEEAVGSFFEQWNLNSESSPAWEIVGVIKDYNYLSLKSEVYPVATFYGTMPANLVVSFNGENPSELIAEMEKSWLSINPEVPFEFTFLDEEMSKVYAEEIRLKKVAYTFTGLAILISLLGIWGLVSFSLDQRTKEIGVRKVLGASLSELTQLLSKEFIVLVAISVVIGAPLAYIGMNQWLEKFTDTIDNTSFLLIGSALITLLVAMITVIYKTTNAANANPINSIMKD